MAAYSLYSNRHIGLDNNRRAGSDNVKKTITDTTRRNTMDNIRRISTEDLRRTGVDSNRRTGADIRRIPLDLRRTPLDLRRISSEDIRRTGSGLESIRRIGTESSIMMSNSRIGGLGGGESSVRRVGFDNSRYASRISSSRLTDLRMQMLAQAKRVRSTISNLYIDPRIKKIQNERKVMNSLTQLIDSKSDQECKNSLVFKVLEKKIKNHLIKSGKCKDKRKLDETARKMAAFVSDIMKETYKKRKATAKIVAKVPSSEDTKSSIAVSRNDISSRSDSKISKSDSRLRRSSSRISVKSTLETIPEEPKASKTTTTRPVSSEGYQKKSVNTKVIRTKDSKLPPPAKTPQTKTLIRPTSASSSESISIKNEKAKINSWLEDVSDRTKKWTKWIGQTISKAEQSKKRIKSGENLHEVSGDWKRFMQVKKLESESFGDTSDLRKPSDIWKNRSNDKETLRKKGQESIEQWLLKNKVNKSSSRSKLSMNTNSSESVYSVWSSRDPSSIYAGESELTKLRQLGVIKQNIQQTTKSKTPTKVLPKTPPRK